MELTTQLSHKGQKGNADDQCTIRLSDCWLLISSKAFPLYWPGISLSVRLGPDYTFPDRLERICFCSAPMLVLYTVDQLQGIWSFLAVHTLLSPHFYLSLSLWIWREKHSWQAIWDLVLQQTSTVLITALPFSLVSLEHLPALINWKSQARRDHESHMV